VRVARGFFLATLKAVQAVRNCGCLGSCESCGARLDGLAERATQIFATELAIFATELAAR
jgi:hypothetical protein